jgi:vacuolar-type H+-ATPase subunit E/Vma4
MPELIGDVDELVSLIRRSATQSVLDAREEARQESEAIRKSATEEIEQIQAEANVAAEREAEALHRRALAQAALDIQRQHLQRREALLDSVWDEAERRLRLLVDSPRYVAVLKRLALEAAPVLAADTVVLAADAKGDDLLTPERLAEWGAEAGTTFRRAAQPADTWGGLFAADEAGRRVVDNSFPNRLAFALEELREQVAVLMEML